MKCNNLQFQQGAMAHTYNPRYSGGRDQEDCGLKSARAKQFGRSISKKPITKKGLVEWLKW
jgi:hypothetical protein